jgi:hypothetical protein
MWAIAKPNGRSSAFVSTRASCPNARLGEVAKLGQAEGGHPASVDGRGDRLAESLPREVTGEQVDRFGEDRDGPAKVASLAAGVG